MRYPRLAIVVERKEAIRRSFLDLQTVVEEGDTEGRGLDWEPERLFQNRALPSELGRILSHLHGNKGILDAPLTPPDAALCSKTSPRVDESAYCVNVVYSTEMPGSVAWLGT